MITAFGAKSGISARTGATALARSRGPKLLMLGIALSVAVACSSAPDGTRTEAPARTDIRVPDNVSQLDESEVEQRLGRLLTSADGANSLAAQEIEPTETPDEPSIEEILDLLNSATPSPASNEIAISITSETLSQLERPVLSIRTAPAHGTAEVLGPDRIIYTPQATGSGADSFEYELFDGEQFIFSQVVKVGS